MIEEILEEFIDNNRDVTFPFHFEDRANIASSFIPFGFSVDGRTFTRDWTLNFTTNTRIVAAFTGVLYVHIETGSGDKYILIKSFAVRSLNRITGLPDWYPIPRYAKYGPFSDTDINDIIRDLFTDDRRRVTFLTGGSREAMDRRGGVAVLSIPEILHSVQPRYDIILHLIFTHIDIVELILENATVENNRASSGAGLYVYKDIHEYYELPRLAGIGTGIMGTLDIHLHVDPVSGVHSNHTDDFTLFRITTNLPTTGHVPLTYTDPTANTIIDVRM